MLLYFMLSLNPGRMGQVHEEHLLLSLDLTDKSEPLKS